MNLVNAVTPVGGGPDDNDAQAGHLIASAITALQHHEAHAIGIGAAIRRLTPVECERLQGFPDDWTVGQADSTRYRQLGNAVCVPVAEWIGRRIMEVEKVR